MTESRDTDDTELLLAMTQMEPETRPIGELIQDAYKSDAIAQDIIAELRDKTARRWPSHLRKSVRCEKSECSIVDGLMYFRDRNWIPDRPAP